jgi:hypothetical protein
MGKLTQDGHLLLFAYCGMTSILSSLDPFPFDVQESCKNFHLKDLIRFLIVRYIREESSNKLRKEVLNFEGKSSTLLANFYILNCV